MRLQLYESKADTESGSFWAPRSLRMSSESRDRATNENDRIIIWR